MVLLRRPRTVWPYRRRLFQVAAAICLAAFFALPTVPIEGGPSHLSAPGDGGAGLVQVARAYVPTAGVRLTGALATSASLEVVAGLAPTDIPGMAAELALVSTPGSPEYGHYLSASQIADEFAPSPSEYGRAVAYFSDRGLSVTTSPDRWAVTVQGPASLLGPAFGTQFEAYTGPSGPFVEHPTPATLPAAFPWTGVLGLGTESEMHPLVTSAPARAAAAQPAAACSGASPYAPCAIQNAYNVTSLLNSGDNGTGDSIGVVDVYDAYEPQSQLESDVRSFTSTNKIPLGTVHYLYPVPTTTDLNSTYTGWGGEEALDLEWTRVMAPGASIDMTFAPDPTTGLYSSVDWLVAHQEVNVISLSWGEPDVGLYNSYAGACTSACNATSDGSYTILHPVMIAAALEGISVFAASGDCGAAFGTNGVATSYPASDPYVVGVGATNLALSGTSYSSETAWSGNDSGRSSPGCQNQGGSGGGYSPFPRPTWQNETGYPKTVSVRGVPDVSIVGGSFVAGVENGYPTEFAGTSVSCPIWAGIAAIADQVHGAALGFLDPSLYQAARSANASKYFHDVTAGSNGYRAGKGWDPVTGIGSPIASALLPRLGNASLVATPLFTDVSASPRSGTAPLNVTFSSVAYDATSSVDGFDVDFGDGNSTWSINGSAHHRYTSDGVFLARSVAFLTDGNSSVSPPIAIVVGGGALQVALNSSSDHPAAGANLVLNATASGGTAPYRYSYSFGDGTYLSNSDQSSVVHDYPIAGTYCPVVVASDANTPPSGGASPRFAIQVGGATSTSCHGASSVTASISASAVLADLPGDIAFHVAASGGVPPYSIRFVSDDPYVGACNCGMFSTPGNHTVTAFVNDSQSGSTNVSMNVTLFPPIDATFAASPAIGNGSLTTTFSASAIGGYETDAGRTNWTFGDGSATGATGALATHTYTSPGLYVANASLSDPLGGNASGTFLFEVRPSATPDALGIGASVLPAADSLAGDALQFRAIASGGTAPYTYHWDLGPSASAYGPAANESYPVGFCPVAPSCLLDVYLNVTDSVGASVHAIIPLVPAVGRPGSALVLTDSLGPTSGVTPLLVSGSASASGMPETNLTWSFGTGALTYGPASSYQYLLPGNYTVTVLATDPFGDRVVHSHAVTVTGLARTLPSISGGPAVSAGVAPFLVAFDASASGGAGPPYSFAWEFGDGTIASTGNVDHTYPVPGNYTADLTVTDSIGTPATESYPIVVYNATPVFLAATAPTSPVSAGSTVSVRFVAIPLCTNRSVPDCSAGPADLAVGLSGGTTDQSVALNSSGEATYALTAPSLNGTYLYSATVVGGNFTGQTTFTVNVSAPRPIPISPTTPATPPPYWEYAGIAVAAIVVVTLLFVLLRRRAAAPPSP